MVNADEIDGTINFGIKLTNKFFLVLFFCFTILVLICLIPAILYFFSVDEVVEELTRGDLWWLMIFSVAFLVVDLITLLIFIRQKYFFKRKINEFLNDPLLIERTAKIYEFSSNGFGWYKTYKVATEFEYDGEEINIIGKKYCKQFKKFLDKETIVLYSPKYDEVMFIKDSSIKT